MKKLKIAIITNFQECCTKEDYIIAKSFAEDGHHVDMLNFPIIVGYENNYDLIVFKNAWDLSEDTYKNYFIEEEKFFKRIEKSKAKIVNTLDGKLDIRKKGKRIVVELFKQGYNVVPTIDKIEDFHLLPKANMYVKKPITGYDGFDMQFIDKDQVANITLDNDVLQPKLDFTSEVQMYFINDKFEYALEYTPSKWPDYPIPQEITPTKEEIDNALKFIKLNNLSCGFGRIDFLRLNDNSLIMLELADSNPNMSLPYLKRETSNNFLKDFKTTCYNYIENKKG